ncbi:MAG: ribosome maturation factor RimM [Caulobacteraceae bacterium]|nr:ribosome maturation factor RimM [Caulobacteraceae bacterium]
MSERLIEVGRVAGAFGVRGEVRITTFTADPLALMRYRALRRADGSPALTLSGGRAAKGGIVARAKEVETREQAEALRGLRLYIARDALPPPEEDEFYLADLVGLEARAPDGEVVGRIRAVENFGAGDLLEITPAAGGPTWWLPFTKEAAPEVNITGGFVTVIRPAEVEADAKEGTEAE